MSKKKAKPIRTAKKTTARKSKGTKLHSVRGHSGKFKDISASDYSPHPGPRPPRPRRK